MRSFLAALPAVLAIADVAAAAALPDLSTTEPCAAVSAAWAAQHAAAPTVQPTVPAQLAYDCLNSAPLGKQEAIDLVDAMVPYLEWQSDAAYKVNPPAGYDFPAYDMFAAIANIRSNLEADVYANEYQFQAALYEEVFGPAHDGHLVYYPDLLTAVFEWTRETALVSISEDGSSLPVIKVYEDVITSPETASVVKLINGIDASKYLQEHINRANWNRDADSAYNSIFYEQPLFATTGSKGYFTSGGRIRYIYPGSNTTFTFENGTQLSFENHATIKKDLSGIVDGPSFYAKFCNPANPAVDVPESTIPSDGTSTTTDLPGYPKPIIITSDKIVSGYFLEGEGFEDVAVIALTGFDGESYVEFQAVVRDFFAAALAAGKTKLVVDLQQNTGGQILLGYDFFRQLFPQTLQDGFSRWKANDLFNALSEIVSDFSEGVDPYTSDQDVLISWASTVFNWRADLNVTNQPFTSYEDKFAPRVFENTPYTANMRWDLDSPFETWNASYGMGIEITGYGNLSDVAQPFEPENIVILQNGVCASTCTLAAEFLKHHAGVKSIAMGGRPQEGPIESVGGTKGSQVSDWNVIWLYIDALRDSAETAAQNASFVPYTDLPLNRSTSAVVNVRDEILRANLEDGVPSQYVDEPADCRLYWTAPMVGDVTEVWRAAAAAAFNGGKCAYGGIERRDVSDAAEVRRREYLADFALRKRDVEAPPIKGPPIYDLLWRDKYVLKAVE